MAASLDILDVIIGVYIAMILHSLTMSILTNDGTRGFRDGLRDIAHTFIAAFRRGHGRPDPPSAVEVKEAYDWYVQQERDIRRETMAREVQAYQQQQQQQQTWTAQQTQRHNTAWGETVSLPTPAYGQDPQMLFPVTKVFVPPSDASRPQQSTHLPTVVPVKGSLQRPIPTVAPLQTRQSPPVLVPLTEPDEVDDAYRQLLGGEIITSMAAL